MTAWTIGRSAFTTAWLRYIRSWGLWVLLAAAMIGTRFMVPRDDGMAVVIAVDGQVPVATSAFVGVALGITVTVLLLPVGFVYLRSNITRRVAWQIEAVTAGSRIALTLGRFAADAAMFGLVLVALTGAGWLLAWLNGAPGRWRPADVAVALWLIAAPALLGLGALRALLDALPATRRGWGEAVFLVLWLGSIAAPLAAADRARGFGANMADFAGFMSPLLYTAPPGDTDLVIGGDAVKPGRLKLDVMAGVLAPGYATSRLAWAGVAVAVAALAGALHRQHRPRLPRVRWRLAAWLEPQAAPPANPAAPPAAFASPAWPGLILAEFRLIGAGRPFLLLAAGAALLGLAGPARHIASPAALLLLVFALTAQAGRAEARGLRGLMATLPSGAGARRAAFVAAGLAWSVLLAVPSMLVQGAGQPLALALATGAAASLAAIGLAAVSGSAFAPRLVLLVGWYGYLNT